MPTRQFIILIFPFVILSLNKQVYLIIIMILSLLNSRVVFYASFRKFAQTMMKIQQTPSLTYKKTIIQDYYKQSISDDQLSIINILNFIRDKPKTGLGEKILTNFVFEKYFSEQELQSSSGTNFDELIDSLEDVDNQQQSVSQEQEASSNAVKLQQVQQFLNDLKVTEGKGSAKKKLQMLDTITQNMKVIQVRVLLRILAKHLRIGLTDKSLQFKRKQEVRKEQQVEQNINGVSKVSFSPMLSQPLPSLQNVLAFCKKKGDQNLIADLKYDGQRTLIIFQKGKNLQLMSRRKKIQTDVYKVLSTQLQKQLEQVPYLQSIRIDGQIVCVSDKWQPLPMQLLMSKRGKESFDESIHKVLVYAFDVIEYNGESLMDKCLVERRKFIPSTQHIKMSQFITFKYPTDNQKLLAYYRQALERKYEGLIIKGENDGYATNGTRKIWGKFKKGCKIEQMDTGQIDLDLVVMGADFGKGKKSQHLAGFLMGTYHEGKLYPVSRLGSGFKDQQLQKFTELLQKCQVEKVPQQYSLPKALKMDVYFEPKYVFKVICQELTRSPLFRLGYIQNQGGISLRFPVFAGVRDDKDPISCQSQEILQLVNDD